VELCRCGTGTVGKELPSDNFYYFSSVQGFQRVSAERRRNLTKKVCADGFRRSGPVSKSRRTCFVFELQIPVFFLKVSQSIGNQVEIFASRTAHQDDTVRVGQTVQVKTMANLRPPFCAPGISKGLDDSEVGGCGLSGIGMAVDIRIVGAIVVVAVGTTTFGSNCIVILGMARAPRHLLNCVTVAVAGM
jgi:hypothetical protein